MKSISELDEFTQKAFHKIVAKEPQELNDGEVAFIRGRRDYLGVDLEKKFASILEEPKKEAKTEKK